MNSEQTTETGTRASFRRKLLRWYDAHRRDLPWRRTKDAYRIWVSEIMLQQTRVGAVLDHYRRFFERFPDVNALARAREQSVLAAWSGLGYYRRARNLHAAAKVVAFERDGVFPPTAAELRALPGIGRYTAAAIASIAFGERAAVVDGNVERVLARLTGQELGPREMWDTAEKLLSAKRPADFNQAMMELGALVCLPREPKCLTCPVIEFCETRGTQPRRAAKENRKTQMIAYGLARKNGSVWLVQRAKNANLMAGMWELPALSEPDGAKPLGRFRHSILDTDFDVAVYAGDVESNGQWVQRNQLPQRALTGLTRKILRHFELL
jgi:A/G-specific adenine glycosylase